MNELNDIALVVPVVFFPFPSFLPSLLRGGLYVAGRGACDVSADVLIFFFRFSTETDIFFAFGLGYCLFPLDGMFHLKFPPQ